MFSYPADVYELLRSEIRDLSAEIKFLKNYVPKEGTVLDLGSGTGTVAIELAKRLGASVTGIDINQHFVEYSDSAKLQSSGNVEFHCADISNLGKALKPFGVQKPLDVVLCMFGVLPLLDYDQLPILLTNIRSWIKPNGVLVLDVGLYLKFVERYEPSQVLHHGSSKLQVTRLIRHSIDAMAGVWKHEEELFIDREGTQSRHHTQFKQHVLKATELSYMLHMAGFESLSFFTGYDGTTSLGRDSQCILVVAKP
jgi:SAM-dependent methyltransferase